MKLKYIGGIDEVEIRAIGVTVARGDEFEVDAFFGESLLQQPTNFEPADDEAQAYIDSLDDEQVAAHHGIPLDPPVEDVPVVEPVENGVDVTNLDASNVVDLKTFAKEQEIPLDGAAKKADIVTAIEKSLAVVGERGPELIEVPGGAQVEPLGDTPKQPTGPAVSDEPTITDEES